MKILGEFEQGSQYFRHQPCAQSYLMMVVVAGWLAAGGCCMWLASWLLHRAY
jgi:hypothetical protein